uniref:FAD-dependent oxidoreductase domain-containing protein 1 n=1 Tax=Phallusia mammillata TaxID=59560 RepID=A0A6F9DD98_9ASCI|nr:FAD-dependent oxidoreductase domain-containing protein 1 [Phallusia mammillata]
MNFAMKLNSLCARLNLARKLSSGCYQSHSASALLQSQVLQNTSSRSVKYWSPFKDDEAYDIWSEKQDGPILLPQGNQCEYFIIGGGIMGQAMAYNLWRRIERVSVLKAKKEYGAKIVICEKDPTMCTSSTALSVGGIRSQFSHPSNIQLSMESAHFIDDIKVHLSTVDNPDPDIQFQRQGYLMLATPEGSSQLMQNYQVQVDTGAKVMLMTQEQLKEMFPWINVEGIELATYGLEHEGWFDPSLLHQSFKCKNPTLGIQSLKGEVVGFKKEIYDRNHPDKQLTMVLPDGSVCHPDDRVVGVYVKHPDHDKPVHVKAAHFINCAGPLSGKVAELCGIGTDNPDVHPLLKVKLPVERRKRYVYVVHCPDAPMFDFPFFVDPSGFWIRREGFGGKYVCGASPTTEADEPDTADLEVDYQYFDEYIWPRLAKRIPAFENLKVTSAWAGYYDFNTFDENGIIGSHPIYNNMWFLTGFSGHGIQQAYGASYMLSEQMINYKNMPALEPMGFMRLVNNHPMVEINCI